MGSRKMDKLQPAVDASPHWSRFAGQFEMHSHDQNYASHVTSSMESNKTDMLPQQIQHQHCPQSFQTTTGVFNGSMADMLNGINLHSPVPDREIESNVHTQQSMQINHSLPNHVTTNAIPDTSKKNKAKKSKLKTTIECQEGEERNESPPKRKRRRIAAPKLNGMTEEEVLERVLPDHLCPNLDIVVIGINPGLASACVGHHYAGPANHFWKCMYLSGLIPEPLTAYDDHKLLTYGIGFTNIVARTTRTSTDLSRSNKLVNCIGQHRCFEILKAMCSGTDKKKEIKAGAVLLKEKIEMYKPKIAVFNGIGIYELFLGRKDFHVGKQPYGFPGAEDTTIFVMPSSSARFTQLPRAVDKIPFYLALKKLRDYLCGRIPAPLESEISFPEANFRIIPKSQRPGYKPESEEKRDQANALKRSRSRKSKSDEDTLTEESIDDSGIAVSITPEDQELMDDIAPIISAIADQNVVKDEVHFSPNTSLSLDLGICLGHENPNSVSILDQSEASLTAQSPIEPPECKDNELNFSPGSQLNFSPLNNSTQQSPVTDRNTPAHLQSTPNTANRTSDQISHDLLSNEFRTSNPQNDINIRLPTPTIADISVPGIDSLRAAFSPGLSSNSPRPTSNHSSVGTFPPVSMGTGQVSMSSPQLPDDVFLGIPQVPFTTSVPMSNPQFSPRNNFMNGTTAPFVHSNQQGFSASQSNGAYSQRHAVPQAVIRQVNYQQMIGPQLFHQQMLYSQGIPHNVSPYFENQHLSNLPSHQYAQQHQMQSSNFFQSNHQMHTGPSAMTQGSGHANLVNNTQHYPNHWNGGQVPQHGYNFMPENGMSAMIGNPQQGARHPYWNTF